MENQLLIPNESENAGIIDARELRILSVNKFIILSIFSFGLYEPWWVYKAWCYFRDKEEPDAMPAARTIFGIFFLLPLFKRILKLAKSKGYSESYNPALLFVGALVVGLLYKLPDPFWLISFFTVAFYIPPLKAFNYAILNSKEINIEEQEFFNTRQKALMAIGIIFWILVLLGLTATLLGIE